LVSGGGPGRARTKLDIVGGFTECTQGLEDFSSGVARVFERAGAP
jgi:hypothetical protein